MFFTTSVCDTKDRTLLLIKIQQKKTTHRLGGKAIGCRDIEAKIHGPNFAWWIWKGENEFSPFFGFASTDGSQSFAPKALLLFFFLSDSFIKGMKRTAWMNDLISLESFLELLDHNVIKLSLSTLSPSFPLLSNACYKALLNLELEFIQGIRST